MAGAPLAWKGFAVEQPGWLESLALPDSSGLAAVLCWLVLVSTMAVRYFSKLAHQTSTVPSHLECYLRAAIRFESWVSAVASRRSLYLGNDLVFGCLSGWMDGLRQDPEAKPVSFCPHRPHLSDCSARSQRRGSDAFRLLQRHTAASSRLSHSLALCNSMRPYLTR